MRRRWTDMSRAARFGLVAAVLVSAMVVLAVVSRLGGTPDAPATVPTSTPAPARTSTDEPASAPVATESPVSTTDPDVNPLPELPKTADPDEYAAAVAHVVLGLNPREYARQDYLELLYGEINADVVAEDRKRIEPIIESWLPDEFQWQRQRDYAQVNSFAVESVWVPEIIQDATEDIPDGYQVRTVAGTQTTEFLDENDDVANSSTPRLLTVIAFCPSATAGDCSLVSIPQEVQR